MLKADSDRIKGNIKRDELDESAFCQPFDKDALISLASKFFTKKGLFVVDKASGNVEEREYIDYSPSLGEVLEVIRNNRKEIMKGW